MIILAIETSSEQGSLALAGDCEIDSVDLDVGPAQSTTALGKLRGLLVGRGLSAGDLDAIAFGSGPGMFTGLRLGCGLAQGLAIGLVKPVVAVSSLEVLANPADAEWVMAVTDARMGEIYGQGFHRTADGLQPCGEPRCLPPERLELPPGGTNWRGVGNGFEIYRDRFPRDLLQQIDIDLAQTRPQARDVALIARRRLARGEFTPLSEVVPQYVRNKVALTTRERLERGGRI